jgi:hypothetical protein
VRVTGWKRALRAVVMLTLALIAYFVVPVEIKGEDLLVRVVVSFITLGLLTAGIVWQILLHVDDPNRQIDGLHIHDPIRQRHLDGAARMRPREGRHHRNDHRHSVVDGGGYPQHPARLFSALGELDQGLGRLPQDRDAPGVQLAAGVGERELARRTKKERHAQLFFQPRDLLAHDRLRDP